MHITTKLMIGVALAAWFGFVAAEAANAQSYSPYAYGYDYGYGYGGGYGNSYDRAGSTPGGGM